MFNLVIVQRFKLIEKCWKYIVVAVESGEFVFAVVIDVVVAFVAVDVAIVATKKDK